MALLRVNGVIWKTLLVAAVVLWFPFIVPVLKEAVYFVGFVPLGWYLWFRRSRLYGPRKPAPLSSTRGATAATEQAPASATSRADEKEFKPAAAIVGFSLFLLQGCASTYWYVRVPEDSGPYALVVSLLVFSTSLLAAIIDALTE